jgi:hypothetical protein
VRIRIARAVALGHSAGAHRAPFVVVAFEPDLEQIREAAIVRDVARRQVAVVIENRLSRREFVVKPPRRPVLEQKIVVYVLLTSCHPITCRTSAT